MRKTIEGVRYDTELGRLIVQWEKGEANTYCCEKLLHTASGKYFLHGFGGPASIYGRYIPDGSIIPLTYEQAKAWVADRFGKELVAYEIADPERDKKPIRIGMLIAAKAHRVLTEEKAKTGLSLSELVTNAILRTYGCD